MIFFPLVFHNNNYVPFAIIMTFDMDGALNTFNILINKKCANHECLSIQEINKKKSIIQSYDDDEGFMATTF